VNSLCVEDMNALKKGDSIVYRRIYTQLKDIIYSKLSGYEDIGVYIDDLISNAFMVLMRTFDRYDNNKAKFSTYAFNRIVSASRKQYLALKYPFSGIKALSGKRKVDIDNFKSSALAYILYSQDLCIEVSSESIDDINSYIKSLLNPNEERRLLPRIMQLVNGFTTPPDMRKDEYTEILNIFKERMGY